MVQRQEWNSYFNSSQNANFSTHYCSGTQRLSYHGYERQDHPMKSSVTHSVTNSHTHTHTQHKTTGRREVGGGVNSKSVQLHQLIPVGTQEAFCRWVALMSVGLCWSTTWAAFPATPSAGRAQERTACNYCIIALFTFFTRPSTEDSEQTFRGQPEHLQHDKVKHILNAPAQRYLHNDLIFCQLWRLCETNTAQYWTL